MNAAVAEGAEPASLLERMRDRVRHGLLRAFDLTVPVLYSLVPVPLWKRYRRMKSHYREGDVNPGENLST